MPTPSTAPATRGNKHLLLASQYVTDSWIPVNVQHLEYIKSNIKSGVYKDDSKALLCDVRKDVAIYLYCLKELAEQISEERKKGEPIERNLISSAHRTEFQHLVKIIDVSPSDISAHSLNDLSKHQAARVSGAIISATTAEALAQPLNLDPITGFSCALLRQLGLTLIAFNYPHVYARTVSAKSSTEEIDQNLTRVLGFSPVTLAIRLAKSWGIEPEIGLAMGEECEGVASEQAAATASTLSKICEIGEALARANDPDHYPSAAKDWEYATQHIKELLGPDGISIIQKKIQENCSHYSNLEPELFKFTLPNTTPTRSGAAASYAKERLANNLYLKRCPQILQQTLVEVYATISPGQVAKESVDKLIKQAIPSAGFIRGCIYLLEPARMELIPRLKIGPVQLSRFRSISVSYIATSEDPIATAFHCKIPLKEDNVLMAGEQVSYVAGTIGNHERAGVLYLELSENLIKDHKADPMLYFKAIRHALNDCLGLR